MKNIFASALLLAAASAQQVTETPSVKATTESFESFNSDLIVDDLNQGYALKNFRVKAKTETDPDILLSETLFFDLANPYTTFAAAEVADSDPAWDIGANVTWIDGVTGVEGTGALCHSHEDGSDFRCTDTEFKAVLNDNVQNVDDQSWPSGQIGFGRPNVDNGLHSNFAYSLLKNMKANKDDNTQEFAIGTLDNQDFNISFGAVNDAMWKASADDEARVGASAKPETLNWSLDLVGWYVDGALQEFEGASTEVEWTDGNMSKIPSADYAYLEGAFSLTDGKAQSSCADAGISTKKIAIAAKGDNGTSVQFTIPFNTFWKEGQDPSSPYCGLQWIENTDNNVLQISRQWFKQYYTIFEVDEEQKMSFQLGQQAEADAEIVYLTKAAFTFKAASGLVAIAVAALAF